jgi:hypothetical protein
MPYCYLSHAAFLLPLIPVREAKYFSETSVDFHQTNDVISQKIKRFFVYNENYFLFIASVRNRIYNPCIYATEKT